MNYNKFSNKIIELKNKHLPRKLVKFKKYKHKHNAWMTNGLLASIRQKDYLYKKLKTISRNNPNYNRFIGALKNTWSTINTILNKYRSKRYMQNKFQINGNLIEGEFEVASEFNKFFYKYRIQTGI